MPNKFGFYFLLKTTEKTKFKFFFTAFFMLQTKIILI